MFSRVASNLIAVTLIVSLGFPSMALSNGFGSVKTEDAANTTHASKSSSDKVEQGIACLRVRIDAAGNVDLVERMITGGIWQDHRSVPVGPRFFFAVVDSSGEVLASGYRRDPRHMNSMSQKSEFLLTVPYDTNVAKVELYSVSYESGGKDAYSRCYTLLASFDMEKAHVAVND